MSEDEIAKARRAEADSFFPQVVGAPFHHNREQWFKTSLPAALDAETEAAAGDEPTEIPPPTPALSQTLQQMIAQGKASKGNLGLQSGVWPKILPACWAGQGNTALSPETAKFR